MKTVSVQEQLQGDQGLLYPPEAQIFLELTELGKTDGVSCWRSEAVERRGGSSIEGKGLFALADIPPNTMIAIKPGHVVDSQTVKTNADLIRGSQQQIGPNEFLVGLTEEEVDKNLIGYNHSCDPNAKVVLFKGASLAFLVTRRPIEAGQEITTDYSVSQMTNTHLMQFCHCGAADCRGVITPLWDWEDEDFQEKYAGEFVWFIQDVIDELKELPPERRPDADRTPATFKMAAVTVLADEEVKRREQQRDDVLPPMDGPLRIVMAKIFDYSRAGRYIRQLQMTRLRSAAYFCIICPLANIDDFGVDREKLAAMLEEKNEAKKIAGLNDQLGENLDGILRLARNLDYYFNR